jgi:YfiH family protein
LSGALAIEAPILVRAGVRHGFGMRGFEAPTGTLRPKQVHGVAVATPDSAGRLNPEEADAVVSARPDACIAIVTADCVPILAAASDGSAVAAIHAGWRGLAAGVVAAGIEALRALAGRDRAIVAAIGPHIGSCCYEVDEPVLSALGARFGDAKVQQSQHATRPGHARIALAELVVAELIAHGVALDALAKIEDACTACHPERFESHRRDGSASGRLIHYVAAR